MPKAKIFCGIIPVTANVRRGGASFISFMKSMQNDFIRDNFHTDIRDIIKDDSAIAHYCKDSEFMAKLPVSDVGGLCGAIWKRFYSYVLNSPSFKYFPVLAQYEFHDKEEAPYSWFVLGGNENEIYVINANYRDDTMNIISVRGLPFVYGDRLTAVKPCTVKTVGDVFRYHKEKVSEYADNHRTKGE